MPALAGGGSTSILNTKLPTSTRASVHGSAAPILERWTSSPLRLQDRGDLEGGDSHNNADSSMKTPAGGELGGMVVACGWQAIALAAY